MIRGAQQGAVWVGQGMFWCLKSGPVWEGAVGVPSAEPFENHIQLVGPVWSGDTLLTLSDVEACS